MEAVDVLHASELLAIKWQVDVTCLTDAMRLQIITSGHGWIEWQEAVDEFLPIEWFDDGGELRGLCEVRAEMLAVRRLTIPGKNINVISKEFTKGPTMDKPRSGKPDDVHLDPATFAAGQANLAHAVALAYSGNTAMRGFIVKAAEALAEPKRANISVQFSGQRPTPLIEKLAHAIAADGMENKNEVARKICGDSWESSLSQLRRLERNGRITFIHD
jgi:hypothetical protein